MRSLLRRNKRRTWLFAFAIPDAADLRRGTAGPASARRYRLRSSSLSGSIGRLVVDYINRLTGSVDAAEDIAQRAFCQLWDRRAQWRASGSVRALLCRIARNYAVSEHRRQRADERSAETFAELSRPVLPSRDRVETEQLRSALDREIALLARAATRDSRAALRTRSLV